MLKFDAAFYDLTKTKTKTDLKLSYFSILVDIGVEGERGRLEAETMAGMAAGYEAAAYPAAHQQVDFS